MPNSVDCKLCHEKGYVTESRCLHFLVPSVDIWKYFSMSNGYI